MGDERWGGEKENAEQGPDFHGEDDRPLEGEVKCREQAKPEGF